MKLVSPGSSRLCRFQEHFARALVDSTPPDDSGAGVARLITQPGFAVYRNTVLKGCIDALQANFPAVTRLVGEEWMRAAAAEFARANPPARPMLLEYGAQFPSFLGEFAPAAELPYLAGVAHLDRLWTEAHCARDEEPVASDQVTALAQDDLAHARLRPHASARWVWFEDKPIFTIWSRNRNTEQTDAAEIVWRGEGALLVRPGDTVETCVLERGDVAFLDVCAAGKTLADAAIDALAADAGADLAQSMARLLSVGAFGRIQIDRR